MVPVDLPLRMQCDIRLTYHADANKIPRVRRLIEWIMKSFDPEKFPWFREDFARPKDFGGRPLVSLFEGFRGAGDGPESGFRHGSAGLQRD